MLVPDLEALVAEAEEEAQHVIAQQERSELLFTSERLTLSRRARAAVAAGPSQLDSTPLRAVPVMTGPIQAPRVNAGRR
jgi:hypothetical protein